MKNESVTMETEIIEKTGSRHPLGIAFSPATMVKSVPREGRPGLYGKTEAVGEEWKREGGLRPALGEFLKPTVSNVFLLGCLIGLFVLYCGSCVVHALTFPARRKSS
jgi:hypothetical protein